MKVVLYPRVSSKEQLKGDSIEAQERRLREFCKQKDYDVVDVLTDGGKSASLKEENFSINLKGNSMVIDFDLKQRPAFKKIIEDAGNGKFQAICFFKWDRFARSVIFAKLSQIYFNNKNIELIPSDDSTDPLTSSIMQVLSEEEIRKMKERVRSSRLERFERGMMVARPPVGYKLRNKKIEIDEKKAKMIRKIFQMTLDEHDYKVICKELGIAPTQYYNIIRNKAYAGFVTFEGVEKKGNHTPIVSEADWRKCNVRKD